MPTGKVSSGRNPSSAIASLTAAAMPNSNQISYVHELDTNSQPTNNLYPLLGSGNIETGEIVNFDIIDIEIVTQKGLKVNAKGAIIKEDLMK